MTKYSLDTQLAAIQAYLNGVESYKDKAKRYGVDSTHLLLLGKANESS